MNYTDDQLKKYAKYLLYDSLTDIARYTIYETAEMYFDDDEELTEEQAERVHNLVVSATVEVSWDE